MAANIRAAGAPAGQLAWLRSELQRATASCAATLMIGHHPVYSGGDHGSSPDLIASLEPLLAEFGVDGYVAGHDHMLGHLVWPPPAAEQGSSTGSGQSLSVHPRYTTDYFVNGAGSEIRNWWSAVPQAQWHLNANGFMVHSVNASHIRHSFVSLAARDVVYSVTRRLKHGL
jgi:hypothetical protein